MSFFDKFRRKHSKMAVVTNSSNVTVNQIENFTQKEEASVDWVGLTIFDEEGRNSFYEMEESENDLVVKPMFTLQNKSDWPGRFKMEFPVTLDFTFNNSGDKPAVLNSVEFYVSDARIDNQAAFEASPQVSENGYLMLQLENYGWGNNEVISYEPFTDKAAGFWSSGPEAFESIRLIEGHLTLILRPELAQKLLMISEKEHKLLIKYQNQLRFWTPEPPHGSASEETKELKQFLSLRNKLIADNKILNSEIFSGRIVYRENGLTKEYKLSWGHLKHQATFYDLIRTEAGFGLLLYQHPLAYLPPGKEYNAGISVNDKGKTIKVKTSQSIEGGKSDRFLVTVRPQECLFAEVTLKVYFNRNREIVYPKPIRLNLLAYKNNGDFEKEQKHIDTKVFEYSIADNRLVSMDPG